MADQLSALYSNGPRRAAYEIKKLRAKGMVCRIGKSRRYEPVPEGLRSLTALLVLREKIIRPLLAASGQPERPANPAHPTPVDYHYESRSLFTEPAIAAEHRQFIFHPFG